MVYKNTKYLMIGLLVGSSIAVAGSQIPPSAAAAAANLVAAVAPLAVNQKTLAAHAAEAKREKEAAAGIKKFRNKTASQARHFGKAKTHGSVKNESTGTGKGRINQARRNNSGNKKWQK